MWWSSEEGTTHLSEVVKQSFLEEMASNLAPKVEKEIREEEGKGIQGMDQKSRQTVLRCTRVVRRRLDQRRWGRTRWLLLHARLRSLVLPCLQQEQLLLSLHVGS